MTVAILSLVIGLIGLVAAGTAIVRGAATIGLRLGLPPTVVGLTIVAAGTSAPELAVVWRAADAGDPELALGSVIGSNIANILLVLGLVACIGVVPVAKRTARIDVPVMIAASLLALALSLDGAISPTDGIILLTGLAIYLAWTVISSRTTSLPDSVDTTSTGDGDTAAPTPLPLLAAVALFAIGAVGVAIAAQFVVSGGEEIALSLGVPELVVGLTVIAIGTSAPEIATSTIAAIRGDREVAVGNAIGSNVFNLLFVLGAVSATHSALPVPSELVDLDMPVMLATAAICLPFALTGARFGRIEGLSLVGLYVGYVTYLVSNAIDSEIADPVGAVTLFVGVPLALAVSAVDLVRSRRSSTDQPGEAIRR